MVRTIRVLPQERRKIRVRLGLLQQDNQGWTTTKNFEHCLLAGTGVGKSLFMCHMAASTLMQGKNVLYITLEMAEERIAERIDANLMNITMDDLHELPKKMFTDPNSLRYKQGPTES